MKPITTVVILLLLGAIGTSSNIRGVQQLPLQSYMSLSQAGPSSISRHTKGTTGPPPSTVPCGGKQVLRADGLCVTPRITRNIYYFNAPSRRKEAPRLPNVRRPKVIENILLVRLPAKRRETVVVPPPEQRHYVFFLKKASGAGRDNDYGLRPFSPATKPEVYFIRYSQDQKVGGVVRGGGITGNEVRNGISDVNSRSLGGFNGGNYANSRDLYSANEDTNGSFFVTGGDIQDINNISYK
ncbi:uncharacterized protein [Palaemon carinicauda]|uniref:uncharacterized protein n=1 Tax=Palaemon carinicauda TaxID=392227 RepID=UPI0035B5C3F7